MSAKRKIDRIYLIVHPFFDYVHFIEGKKDIPSRLKKAVLAEVDRTFRRYETIVKRAAEQKNSVLVIANSQALRKIGDSEAINRFIRLDRLARDHCGKDRYFLTSKNFNDLEGQELDFFRNTDFSGKVTIMRCGEDYLGCVFSRAETLRSLLSRVKNMYKGNVRSAGMPFKSPPRGKFLALESKFSPPRVNKKPRRVSPRR